MKRALAACATAALIAVSGCGSSTSTQGSSDPANVAPANTLAYASFDMAPTGPEKADFDAAFSKLLGADPETKLGEAFTKAVQTSSLSYADDVKPWLAGPVAVALTGVGQNSCDFALLMPSSDDGKAQAAIAKDLAGTGAQDRTYRDVAYKLQGDGTANGIVDHVVVAGTETAFKDVVDANLPGVQRVAAPMLLGMVDLHPFVATLDAQPDSLIVDVASPGTKVDPNGPGAASSPLIESFPADSWLALAVPKAGAALGKLEAALKSNPLIGAEFANIAASVRAQTGIDLDKDVVAALGDVGLFVRGTTPATAAATLVTRPTRPGALANTMKRLPAVIVAKTRGRAKVTPQASGFDVAGPRGKRRLLVRTGVRAQAKLGNTVLFKKAAALIGQRPTFFVNVGPALDLAAQAPRHKSDEHFKAALPRLRHVEYVAAGARRDAGLDVLRGVIGLR